MWLLALLGGVLIIGPSVANEGGRAGYAHHFRAYQDYQDYQGDSEELYISVEDYEDYNYGHKSGKGKHKSLSDSMNYFTTNLFSNLLASEELTGNILVSPFSSHLALGMVANGAKGNTKKEIERALGYSKSDQALNSEYKSVLKKMSGDKNLTLETANKAYFSKEPSKKYTKVIKKTFNDQPTVIDFKNTPEEEIRGMINEFVMERTHGKIKNLISKDLITKNTAFILINALYFKGSWKHKFDEKLTKKTSFYPTSNEKDKIKVPMMRMRRSLKTFFAHMEPFRAKVLHLPYSGDRVSMILILPKERHQLETVIKQIKLLGLGKLLNDLEKVKKGEKRNVWVHVPKFSTKKTLRLNKPLKQLGMKLMFKDGAQFAMLADERERVKVSQVLQKIHLSVYEEGSEATTATAIIGSHFMSATIKEDFKCDEPFLLLLVDEMTKMILFAGKIKDPTLSS